MRKPGFLSSLALGVLIPLCFGQQPGGGQQAPPSTPPGGGGAPGGSPGRTPTPTTPTPTPRQPDLTQPRETQRIPEMERPLFLSGKVVLQDGTAPPDSAIIQLVCGGNPRPQAYTDSKGRFHFQVGQNSTLIPDASVSSASDREFGGFGGTGTRGTPGGSGFGAEQKLMGCELRADLPGYRSTIVNLTGRRFMDNPDVGQIVLHRLGNVEGSTVSVTSLEAPKDAKKAFEKGAENNRKRKWQDAQKSLEKAVELYPKYASAWFELGVAQQAQNNLEGARKSFEQALAADPKFVKPYMPLAGLALKEQKWAEVAERTDKLVRLDPVDFPSAYFYSAVAHFNLRNLDAAEKSAREGVKLDTDHRIPKMEHVLGVILANKRDYASAAQHMRNYLTLAPDAQDAEAVRKQLSDIEKLTGPAAAQVPQKPQQP